MRRPPHISAGVSVAVVFLCLWLVGNLGFTLVLRLTGPWLMPSTSDLTLLVTMLGAFYGARVASQFIALYFASLIPQPNSSQMRPALQF